MAGVQQKVVRTHSVDAMNAPSANNETLSGHTIVSTNQKD